MFKFQVGTAIPKKKEQKRYKKYAYIHVETDKDGWVDAEVYLPISFDLVYLDDREKIVKGWWNGNKWEGLRVKKDIKVKRWKRETESY